MGNLLTLTDTQKEALRNTDVVLAYAHGSLARGTERNDSDIDIAVLFLHVPRDTVGATTRVIEALQGFVAGREIDIAILNDASPLLVQSVAARGTLLYARSSEDDISFQFRAMHDYEASRRIARIGREAVAARV